MHPAFAIKRHPTLAPGSLGFKEGEVVRVDGIWTKPKAPGQKGSIDQFTEEQGVPKSEVGVMWFGMNCATQRKGFFPDFVRDDHRRNIIRTCHAMHTFSSERKRVLEEALETLATYSQLCNVLLAVLSDMSNESITLASTANHGNDLSSAALPHIKEIVRNSHMMEYTSGQKHAKIVGKIMAANTHYDLSIALFEAVEEHALVMDNIHQSKDYHSGIAAQQMGAHRHGQAYADTHGHTARMRRAAVDDYESSDDETYSYGAIAHVPNPPTGASPSSTGRSLFKHPGRRNR